MIELRIVDDDALVRVCGHIDASLAPGLRDALLWAADHYTALMAGWPMPRPSTPPASAC